MSYVTLYYLQQTSAIIHTQHNWKQESLMTKICDGASVTLSRWTAELHYVIAESRLEGEQQQNR